MITIDMAKNITVENTVEESTGTRSIIQSRADMGMDMDPRAAGNTGG